MDRRPALRLAFFAVLLAWGALHVASALGASERKRSLPGTPSDLAHADSIFRD